MPERDGAEGQRTRAERRPWVHYYRLRDLDIDHSLIEREFFLSSLETDRQALELTGMDAAQARRAVDP